MPSTCSSVRRSMLSCDGPSSGASAAWSRSPSSWPIPSNCGSRIGVERLEQQRAVVVASSRGVPLLGVALRSVVEPLGAAVELQRSAEPAEPRAQESRQVDVRRGAERLERRERAQQPPGDRRQRPRRRRRSRSISAVKTAGAGAGTSTKANRRISANDSWNSSALSKTFIVAMIRQRSGTMIGSTSSATSPRRLSGTIAICPPPSRRCGSVT